VFSLRILRIQALNSTLGRATSAAFLSIFVALLTSCATRLGATRLSSPTPVFCLRVASAQDHLPLDSATVYIVTERGTIERVGTTDDFGRACFPKSLLRGTILLLVCHPAHFCGALRGEPGDPLAAYDERYIELAVFALLE